MKESVRESELPLLSSLTEDDYVRIVANGEVSADVSITTFVSWINSRKEFDYIDFVPTETLPAQKEGRLVYDLNNHTLTLYNDVTNTSLQLGQEVWIRVRNKTASTIEDGKVVYVTGATGQIPKIEKASATSCTAVCVLGVVTADIASEGFGWVTVIGNINEFNTNALTEGLPAYLSETAGELTSTAPHNAIQVGICLYKHSVHGKMLVRIGDANTYERVWHQYEAILDKDNWTSNAQTLTLAGITITKVRWIPPVDYTEAGACGDSKVWLTSADSDTDSTVTFTNTTDPSIDLNIVIEYQL